jgi:hypothetical protein
VVKRLQRSWVMYEGIADLTMGTMANLECLRVRHESDMILWQRNAIMKGRDAWLIMIL